MSKCWIALVLFFIDITITQAQTDFPYEVQLEPVAVPNLPGLHSYAVGQHAGKWLVIGSRKDGLHARQPNASFPTNRNNTDIYVIDVQTRQFWTASVNVLPTGLKEQLQSTNMNFYQQEDTLYLIGGYGFSATANARITFPYLTTVQVSAVIQAIMQNQSITPYFKQITHTNFAVTGGQLGKIGNTFYLVGGHRFDGNYNPMNNPTFTQTYTNQIRKFTINNSGSQLSFDNYTTITDAVHLHRRDYNLLPQIFPDGTHGYTISAGVFQVNADLPFLYPVDITENGYTPITTFNQYLSHYHGAKVCLHDSLQNNMHTLFFGGMSQYYYQNGTLVQDNNVPFVKTISRLTRAADGTLTEYQLPIEMPGLKGASSEFIFNMNLPHHTSKIVKLHRLPADTVLLGHIYGGILSPSLNPFTNNQTNTTSADNTIYAVKLIRTVPTGVATLNGKNPYQMTVFPNPFTTKFQVQFELPEKVKVDYFLTTQDGKIIQQGSFQEVQRGKNIIPVVLKSKIPAQLLLLTVVFEDRYYGTQKMLKK